MAWIESHQTLLRHPKTTHLMGILQQADRYKLIGHLHALWWWSLDIADDAGALPKGTSDIAIAEGAGWPTEDASRFVKALKTVGFLEKRGYQLHDWEDYTWRYNSSKSNASGNGSFGNHQRWHVKRGIFEEKCGFCQEANRGDIAPIIASESHLTSPTQPHLTSPTSPTDQPTEATQPATTEKTGAARRRPASESPYNLAPAEWRLVMTRFPGLNVQGLWHEWVGWIEGSEEERKPDDKVAAFMGWLKKKSSEKSPAAV